MSTIINIFGGPGCGKSTQAAALFYEMKKAGYNVEMPYEFPKLQAWEKNLEAVKDQLYITANQHRNISRMYGQVDYIIVDSPILFGLIYKNRYNSTGDIEYPASFYGEKFDDFIIDLHFRYNSINIFLERNVTGFQTYGRFQTLEESSNIDAEILSMLDTIKVQYTKIKVDSDTIKNIIGILK
jgi:deoxyadenosine/deoxycytidine kinase